MKNIFIICATAVTVFLTTLPAKAASASFDTAKIEKITGLKGAYNEAEHVFKVSNPRNDVRVSVDQMAMSPFLGLTSWASFTPGGKADFMVMGDLVLFQDEVNPVMSALLDNGLEATALHNHFFYDDPKVFFMHISGEGTLEHLAQGVKKALEKVKEIRTASASPVKEFGGKDLPAASSISAKAIESIFGIKAATQNGMAKVVIGRKVKMACGCEVGKEMGVNTWAAFSGSDNNAVVDGDFAVLERELQRTLKALRKGGIHIVAIHHHMTNENPRMLFLHYWGKGRAEDLANVIKGALPEEETH